MENPYWHPQYKPHIVEPDELRLLAFEIFGIVRASMSMAGSGMEPDEDEDLEPTELEQLFYKSAETELSKKLLRLAVLMRTLDDYFAGDEDYAEAMAEFKDQIGAAFEWEKSPESEFTLRDAFNKIIHAVDVRPVYHSDDDRENEHARWGMDGQLELEGTWQGKKWHVVVNMIPLLEAVVALADFIETDEAAAPS